MEKPMEEEFYTTESINIGNYSNNNENETFGSAMNYSKEIDEMSWVLQNFYEDFGKHKNYILIGLYVPVIPVAIIANFLVIIVVLKDRCMRSAINYFVVNLSVADLLVTTICMPMAIIQAISITWLYGEIMCKLLFYLQGVAVASSVFTIMAMSIDRYIAIKNPVPVRRGFNRKKISISIAMIWLASLSIFGPLLKAVTVHRLNERNFTLGIPGSTYVKIFVPPPIAICSEGLKSIGINAQLFGSACFILVYAIPVSIILIMYLIMGRTLYLMKPPFDTDSIKGSTSLQQGFRLVRERKRVAWILLVLGILFALCWLPYNVLKLLIDLDIIRGNKWITDILSYCLLLGHVNSMLNPVVYCSMTRTFRHSISEILCRSHCGVTERKPHSNQDRSKPKIFKAANAIAQRYKSNEQRKSSKSRSNSNNEFRM